MNDLQGKCSAVRDAGGSIGSEVVKEFIANGEEVCLLGR